jgi:hypothetical protein
MLGISQENILLGAEVTRNPSTLVYVKFYEDSFNYQIRSRNINRRTCKSDTRIYRVNLFNLRREHDGCGPTGPCKFHYEKPGYEVLSRTSRE